MPSPTKSPAWQKLLDLRESLADRGLARVVHDGSSRFEKFSLRFEDVLFDYSHQELNAEAVEQLLALARDAGLEKWRDRFFGGEIVNVSEREPALHMALRARQGDEWRADGEPVTDLVRAERARCYRFARTLRDGERLGATGVPITDIVNIGIGGSQTGPELLCDALHPFDDTRLKYHFVSNADGADISHTLELCRPDSTLFVVVSNTFTTQEIMLNARTARDWICGELGDAAVAKHFVAVTAQPDRAAEFGIAGEHTFATWDWVGDRFAIWGATALTAMISLGRRGFDEFLDGAREIDEHFRDAPFEKNIPVMMALVGIWNRNFCNAPAHCILPYAEGLRMFPPHLVQLLTEGLAKCVDLDGHPVDYATGPVVWGMQATDGQHAFHQMLHQGTDAVSVDIIGFRQSVEGAAHQHPVLVANLISQVESLLVGQTKDPGRQCAGARSCSVLAFDRLTPRNLGRMIALYEHQVFVQGIIWNLNPFDRWGVELGKHLAQPILEHLQGGPRTKHDPATAGLLDYFTGS